MHKHKPGITGYREYRDRKNAGIRKWRLANLEIVKEKKKTERFRLKIAAFCIYSHGEMSCAICGDNEFPHLSLDHIDGGGTQHRNKDPRANCDLYRLVKTEGYPSGYRVLCHNCNFIEHVKHSRKSTSQGAQLQAKYRNRLKEKTLTAYSTNDFPTCAICNCTDLRVLTLDHQSDDGRAELRKLGVKGGVSYYKYLRDSGFSRQNELRVLCMNHNCGDRIETPPAELVQEIVTLLQSASRIESLPK